MLDRSPLRPAATVGSATPTGRTARLDSLTGMRWWAAFAVFCCHLIDLAPVPGSGVLAFGYLGVAFFFVLSGFVLTWSWSPTVGARRFWWRRFARIYPVYVATILLALPVFYGPGDPAHWWVRPIEPGAMAASLLLVQGWSSNLDVFNGGNPVAWTLSCEAFFYAAFPFVQAGLRRLGRRGASTVAAGALAVVLLHRAVAMTWPGVDLPVPLVRIPEFVAGMAVAWALRRGWRPRLPVGACYAVGAALLPALWWAARTHERHPVARVVYECVGEIGVLVCVALVVALAVRDIRGGRSLLRSGVMVRLGAWSYAFYLVHYTVIFLLVARVGQSPSGWSGVPIAGGALALSVALAAGAHHGVEKPIERGLRRWGEARLGGEPRSAPRERR